MPTISSDSHRGNVCRALSTSRWLNCHQVADAIGYSPEGASSVLSDVHRAGYVKRRDAAENADVEFEYQLKTNVSFE